jgi:hypothetical protein
MLVESSQSAQVELDCVNKKHNTTSVTYYLAAFLKIYQHGLTFSNGQTYSYTSLLSVSVDKKAKQRTDFFSNKLWVILDQPKIFRHLIQFYHRYVGAVPIDVITHETNPRRR